MSVTDYRASRREDEAERRRQDREDRRASDEASLEQQRLTLEAEERRREQDRIDRRERAAQQLAAQQAREQQRLAERQAERDAKEKADKVRRTELAKARKERRERRAAAVRSVPGWVAQHLDLAAALAVMACSIIPALISQASQLADFHLNLVLVALLPVMLECSAWAATAAETKALKAGRAAWPYRIAVWAFASLAGWVNFQHGLRIGGAHYGIAVGSILAASSLVPVGLWQLIQLGRHQEAKAVQRAARAKRRQVRKDRRVRAERYPAVWTSALNLQAIAGGERLSLEAAWEAAWAVHEGAGEEALTPELLTLLSAEMLGIRVEAEERLALILNDLHRARAERLKASDPASGGASASSLEDAAEEFVYVSAEGVVNPPTRTAERPVEGLVDRHGNPLFVTVSPQITPSVPTPARTPESAPARTYERPRADRTRTRREPAGRTLSEGAKRAAAVTAKAFDATENADIERWIADQITASPDGVLPSAKDVVAETVRRRREANEALPKRQRAKSIAAPGRTWVYDRLKNAKKPGAGLHVVRDARSA